MSSRDALGRPDDWLGRLRHAERIQSEYRAVADSGASARETEATALINALDSESRVGARHHVVPRFLLQRWANSAGQVQVYRRIENSYGVASIADLAIKDFYTFVDMDGRKNSLLETLLGDVEREAAKVLGGLLDHSTPNRLTPSDLATLARFSALQVVRTPRHRRESELLGEWYAKTFARGRVSDEVLRTIEVTPHPNDSLRMLGRLAEEMFPLFASRPLALVTLSEPVLLISDEPVVVNAPSNVHHVPDCFRSDEEIQARLRRRRRRDRKKRDEPGLRGRIVHFFPTVNRGVGVAEEIALPVSPEAALVWGPLRDGPFFGPLVSQHLSRDSSIEFADNLNAAVCAQALDWIASRRDDISFSARDMPKIGPIISVCDGKNAAADSVNVVPRRIRPRRLWLDSEVKKQG